MSGQPSSIDGASSSVVPTSSEMDDSIAEVEARIGEQVEADRTIAIQAGEGGTDVKAHDSPSRRPRSSQGRKSATAGSSKESATHSESAPQAPESAAPATGPEEPLNVRFEKFERALEKFLGLIDHRASESAMKSVLPYLDAEEVVDTRKRFIEELKSRILASTAEIGNTFELPQRLAELQELVEEADERIRKGAVPGEEDVKDVWRADLDIETAISARSVAAQRANLLALEQELAELQDGNRKAHIEMKRVAGRANGRQALAKEALDALDQSVALLEQESPESAGKRDGIETRVHAIVTQLMADLGTQSLPT
ncbi:POLYAMINE-MODULATED FACTOR 1 [Ceraceosorus bombacis]|uniref:POLYAMINE-MODULATED FACTOR 1 n=1 Tax=Ceraceosorus bombacis TaxID=401625 RepID=A0A0P1BR01_9BASI|nr:POLYAMINE-MODULATED FACTOR 1 [Ceraceosorus bombacis]